MYFATYINKGSTSIGILDREKNGMIPFQEICKFLEIEDCPADMVSLIEQFLKFDMKLLKNILADKKIVQAVVPLEDVKLCAPIPYPRRNVFCVGKNYLDHVKEVATIFMGLPKNPVFFSKVACPAVGYGDFIDSHPGIVEKLDYEVELAVVIGKKGKNIPKEEVNDYIFGYTIINDVSARILQKIHEQWHKGKSLDTFCPMGPYIIHASELSLPLNLDICCKVNGELRQKSNTGNLIFDIPTLINVLSQGLTLMPGDVIATGTPAGVALGFEPQNKYLRSGDVVECCIEKIGTLKNTIK